MWSQSQQHVLDVANIWLSRPNRTRYKIKSSSSLNDIVYQSDVWFFITSTINSIFLKLNAGFYVLRKLLNADRLRYWLNLKNKDFVRAFRLHKMMFEFSLAQLKKKSQIHYYFHRVSIFLEQRFALNNNVPLPESGMYTRIKVEAGITTGLGNTELQIMNTFLCR